MCVTCKNLGWIDSMPYIIPCTNNCKLSGNLFVSLPEKMFNKIQPIDIEKISRKLIEGFNNLY